ncbi:Gfo/Idh/MocA family oxidoreductase [Jiangella muralis]|uniref:Gfo/Idh/MocA family oxidoreductase n=1 Tax=Jiangella muralis TaxID=702383 RepID=UPI00069ECF59|nr:Gfo/Idh/MocA family oxidoreductase [Jiangella muralis]
MIGTANTHAYEFIGIINGWRDGVPLPERLSTGLPTGIMHEAFGTYLRDAARLWPESISFDDVTVTRLWPENAGEGELIAAACGVQIVDEPADATQDVDAVMVLTEDPHLHVPHSAYSLDARLPTFVDKPLARDIEQATAIATRAEASGTPWYSCSTLRFQPGIDALREALHVDHGGVRSLYIQCPLRAQLYGIHGVELFRTLVKDASVQNIHALSTELTEVVILELDGNRTVTLANNGLVDRMSYVAVIQTRMSDHLWKAQDFGLMNARFLRSFADFTRTGRAPVDVDECLASFTTSARILDELAANRRQTRSMA